MTASAQGRWGGRLTSRELPWSDPSVDALAPNDRAELAEHWLQRAAFERRVGDAFEVIHGILVEERAEDALVRLAERAVDDEVRHAEIARRVASRFAGRDLPAPERLPLTVPQHRGASPSLRRTLHVFGQCALNETFASAVLEASLDAAEGPLAKAALRELLTDEIDHARIGWAHLATLSGAERAELQPWLLQLVRANLKMWRDADRPYPTGASLEAQGAMSRALLEGAVLDGIEHVVIPGLEHVGLQTSEIAGWLAIGAPTN